MDEQTWTFLCITMPVSAWAQTLIATVAIAIAIATPAYHHWNDARARKIAAETRRIAAWVFLYEVIQQVSKMAKVMGEQVAGGSQAMVIGAFPALESMCLSHKEMLGKVPVVEVLDTSIIREVAKTLNIIEGLLLDLRQMVRFVQSCSDHDREEKLKQSFESFSKGCMKHHSNLAKNMDLCLEKAKSGKYGVTVDFYD